ncbi:hypothetical protein M758_5G174000 [Ceratodon purpureus]|nr:hypothetical protein M758_5G174000 [Ceratodon purpureus]
MPLASEFLTKRCSTRMISKGKQITYNPIWAETRPGQSRARAPRPVKAIAGDRDYLTNNPETGPSRAREPAMTTTETRNRYSQASLNRNKKQSRLTETVETRQTDRPAKAIAGDSDNLSKKQRKETIVTQHSTHVMKTKTQIPRQSRLTR